MEINNIYFMSKPFYITSTLPYVNSEPHIGFAMEIIRADIIARNKSLQGFDVFFNTGTDEHGQKIYENALVKGVDVKEYVDGYAQSFKDLIPLLGLSPDINFIRTTDDKHIRTAQEFWKRCFDNGDIYKKNYKIKYCIGCELEKQESELVDDHCVLHPNKDLEIREEENYFFRWSRYQEYLLNFYKNNPNFVIPDFRFNEIKAFVERGLEDFSISRLKSKMSWGVPVPGDDEHVMYVWFDALTSYISTLGWPDNMEQFEKFWQNGTPVQYCGKDNLRQQSAMWQAMLASAKLPQSHNIVIDGFINSGGQKMSKSLGNVISPYDIVNEYGTDALRYYVARELSTFEDSDVTMEKFKESYNANLANGIGNLTSRIMKMAVTYGVELDEEKKEIEYYTKSAKFEENENWKGFDLGKEMDNIWLSIQMLDEYIQKEEPFKKIKINPEEAKVNVKYLLVHLLGIALRLEPFLPETSEKIKNLIKENKVPEVPLFVRKD
ncbi:MAG: methionine--tRNA ligase [Minisyncoccota bacterium]